MISGLADQMVGFPAVRRRILAAAGSALMLIERIFQIECGFTVTIFRVELQQVSGIFF